MVDDLGGRLVQAGLVTRERLAEVLGTAPPHEGALIAGLVDRGVSEDGLAGYFVAEGFGPLIERGDLLSAEPSALALVPASMAAELIAVPIYRSPAGLVVALAAPSDPHAAAELSRAAGDRVLPAVARVQDLRAALAVAYPGGRPSERPPAPPSEPPVLELVRRKDGGSKPYQGSTRGAQRVGARATVGPERVADEDLHVPLVRTKPARVPPPPDAAEPQRIEGDSKFKRVITRNFERLKRESEAAVVAVGEGTARATWQNPEGDDKSGKWASGRALLPPTGRPQEPEVELEELASGEPEPTLEEVEIEEADSTAVAAAPPRAPFVPSSSIPPPPASIPPARALTSTPRASAPPAPEPPPAPAVFPSPRRLHEESAEPAPPRVKTIIPEDHDSWELTAPENRIDASKLDRMRDRTPRPERRAAPALPEIGAALSAIRGATDRDEVVRIGCEAALGVCRASVLLALRKTVLKGWAGAGAGVTQDAVRNLWIPTNTPSVFRDVVREREPYRGPSGTSAADGLFRAATGSRGGEMMLHPVVVGGKLVAVLAADDLSFGDRGARRVEELAKAMGEALERVLVQRKRS